MAVSNLVKYDGASPFKALNKLTEELENQLWPEWAASVMMPGQEICDKIDLFLFKVRRLNFAQAEDASNTTENQSIIQYQ